MVSNPSRFSTVSLHRVFCSIKFHRFWFIFGLCQGERGLTATDKSLFCIALHCYTWYGTQDTWFLNSLAFAQVISSENLSPKNGTTTEDITLLLGSNLTCVVPTGGGFSNYQCDVQLDYSLVRTFHSLVQHVNFSHLMRGVLTFKRLQLMIFMGKCQLRRSFIMDLFYDLEWKSVCVALDQTIDCQPRLSFRKRHIRVVSCTTWSRAMIWVWYFMPTPSEIQVFALTTTVWIENA